MQPWGLLGSKIVLWGMFLLYPINTMAKSTQSSALRFLLVTKKKIKNYFQKSSITWGIEKFQLQKKSFPIHPKNMLQNTIFTELKLRSQTPQQIEAKAMEDLGVKAMEYHLTPVNKDNINFINFYKEKIEDKKVHSQIIEKFWKLPKNIIHTSFKNLKLSPITQQQKELINNRLIYCLEKASISHLWASSRNAHQLRILPEATNMYFKIKQDANFQGDLGIRIDPAFRTDELQLSNHVLASESINVEGYEGPGKIRLALASFGEGNLITFPFFSYDVALDFATKFGFSFMPTHNLKFWEYFAFSSIFYLRIPDILGVFPSTGLIYAKVFVGIGILASYDIKIQPVASVVFQLGIGKIGFCQVEITKNLTRISASFQDIIKKIDKVSVIPLLGDDSETVSVQDYLNNSSSLHVDKMEIALAKDTKQYPSRLQRLLENP